MLISPRNGWLISFQLFSQFNLKLGWTSCSYIARVGRWVNHWWKRQPTPWWKFRRRHQPTPWWKQRRKHQPTPWWNQRRKHERTIASKLAVTLVYTLGLYFKFNTNHAWGSSDLWPWLSMSSFERRRCFMHERLWPASRRSSGRDYVQTPWSLVNISFGVYRSGYNLTLGLSEG